MRPPTPQTSPTSSTAPATITPAPSPAPVMTSARASAAPRAWSASRQRPPHQPRGAGDLQVSPAPFLFALPRWACPGHGFIRRSENISSLKRRSSSAEMKYIGVKQRHTAYDAGQQDTVFQREPEQLCLIRLRQTGSGGCDRNRFQADHLSPPPAGWVCRSHQDRIESHPVPPPPLQGAEERIGG